MLSVSVGLMLGANVSGIVHSSGLGATVRVGNELGAFVVLTTWKADGEFENECGCGVHGLWLAECTFGVFGYVLPAFKEAS